MQIHAAGVEVDADVSVPQPAQGVVPFAHGSGSSRHSPRNTYVANELQDAGLATVLVDLLTPAEERIDAVTAELRFDIGLLARRLTAVSDWLVEHDVTAGLGIGLFGASTGAAAALVTAAARPAAVAAVVSRGGRPDLAGPALRSVHQPTLLIVGERDPVVLDLNRRAMQELAGEARLDLVPGATHLFQEPGTLEQVARLARDWFVRHLRRYVPRDAAGDGSTMPATKSTKGGWAVATAGGPEEGDQVVEKEGASRPPTPCCRRGLLELRGGGMRSGG